VAATVITLMRPDLIAEGRTLRQGCRVGSVPDNPLSEWVGFVRSFMDGAIG
jgi:hypothetical protein